MKSSSKLFNALHRGAQRLEMFPGLQPPQQQEQDVYVQNAVSLYLVREALSLTNQFML